MRVAHLALGTALVAVAGIASLNDPILATIRKWIPAQWDSPKFNLLLGGKQAPGKFKYYEQGHGTTCAVVVGGVLEQLGVSPKALNRGTQFVVGDHLTKLVQWAKRRDAFVNGFTGIEPGDIFYIQGDNPADWHVGFLLKVRGNDVQTADGGQTDMRGNQHAAIVNRRIRLRNKTVEMSGPGGNGWRSVIWHLKTRKL